MLLKWRFLTSEKLKRKPPIKMGIAVQIIDTNRYYTKVYFGIFPSTSQNNTL